MPIKMFDGHAAPSRTTNDSRHSIEEPAMQQCDNTILHSRTRAMRSVLLAVLIPLSFTVPCLAVGPTLEWIRQFGTPSGDGEDAAGLSLDSLGSIYVSGNT